MKMYSEDQIKKVFWKQFHEAGELWFTYLGTKEENEHSTQLGWGDFLKDLDDFALLDKLAEMEE